MSKSFANLLRRHGREVLKLEEDQAVEFGRLVRDMRERVKSKLARMDTIEKPLDAFRLRSVLAEAETAIAALEAKATGFWKAGSIESVDLAAAHLEEEIKRGGMDFARERVALSIDAQAVWADPSQKLLANRFESSVETYGADLLSRVRADLFVGLRAGDSVRDVVRGVAGLEGPLGGIGMRSAERLVRTEISQAYGVAQNDSIGVASKQIPGLVKTWWHTGSYPCPVCVPLHGTTKKIGEEWTIKQGDRVRRVEHPPAHPN